MGANVLTTRQLQLGEDALVGSRLTKSQIDDLISMFRNYLGTVDGSVRTDLENEIDTDNNRCAKLCACLLVWQDGQFGQGGFAATNANRKGYNDDYEYENYLVFRYAYALFYDIPASLDSKYKYAYGGAGRFKSSQTISRRKSGVI